MKTIQIVQYFFCMCTFHSTQWKILGNRIMWHVVVAANMLFNAFPFVILIFFYYVLIERKKERKRKIVNERTIS